MFETDMPAKRQFNVIPSPETVVRLVVRTATYLILAGVLYFTGMWAWHHFTGLTEVQAATTPATQAEATSLPLTVPLPRPKAANTEPEIDPAQFEHLKAEACQSVSLDYDGHACIKHVVPAWSGRGIRDHWNQSELGERVNQGVDHLEGRLGARAESDDPDERPMSGMITEAPQVHHTHQGNGCQSCWSDRCRRNWGC